MCEIFNKRREMKVANALSTADRKSIWLMVKNRHQRLGRNAQKKPVPFLPQQHSTEMLMNKVLTSGKHKTGCLGAEM